MNLIFSDFNRVINKAYQKDTLDQTRKQFLRKNLKSLIQKVKDHINSLELTNSSIIEYEFNKHNNELKIILDRKKGINVYDYNILVKKDTSIILNYFWDKGLTIFSR